MTSYKLLHLLNNYQDGSNTRLALNLTKGLDPNKYQLHVGCMQSIGGPLETEFIKAGIQPVNFGMKDYADLGVLFRLANYIRAEEINIVHTHILRADILAGLVARRMRSRPLLFSTKHNIGYITKQEAGFYAAFSIGPRCICQTISLLSQMFYAESCCKR